jgi:hypothetical protein
MRPAFRPVAPQHSQRDSSNKEFNPDLASQYATEIPINPPPMTMTFASEGRPPGGEKISGEKSDNQ